MVAQEIKIDLRSSIPAYKQLADYLAAQIETGALRADQPLPSESDLIDASGLARGTVRQAIAVLRDNGLVVTVQGRGTYVRPEP